MEIKFQCPTCGEYGDIHKVRCVKNKQIIYVCYECGFIWDEKESPQSITMEEYIAKNCDGEKFDKCFEEL